MNGLSPRLRVLIMCLVCVVGTNVGAETPPNCDALPNCCEVTNSTGSATNTGGLLRTLDNQINKPGGGQCQYIVVTVSSIQPLQTAAILLPGTTLYANGVTLELADFIHPTDHFGCVVDMRAGFHAATDTMLIGGTGAGRLEDVVVEAAPQGDTQFHGVCVHTDDNVLQDVTVRGAEDDPALTYAAVRVEGSGNTLHTVHGENAPFGLHMPSTAENNTVVNATFTDNVTGILLQGSNNRIRGTSTRLNQRFGAWVIGDNNVIGAAETVNGVTPVEHSAVIVRGNSLGGVLVSSGTNNRITRNSIYDNGNDGIFLHADGNELFPKPRLRAVYNSHGSQWALIGLTDDSTEVIEYFEADSAESGEGQTFIDDIHQTTAPTQYPASSINDGQQLFYDFVSPQTLPVTDYMVATATQGDGGLVMPSPNTLPLNTSAFSDPLRPKDTRIATNGDIEDCFDKEWFVTSLEIALKTDFHEASPWDVDFDSDGRTNGEEDADFDCVQDDGETDPATPDTPEDTTPDGDLCAALPVSFCTDTDGDGVNDNVDNCVTVPNGDQIDVDDPDGDGIAQGNGIGDACEDLDDDGIINTEDNCPTIPNSGQEDLDGDTAGDACDFDDDNDGLSDGDEVLAGTDGRVPDTDGDGVCDGHGWGYGLNEDADTRCARPDDNCPLRRNANQRDVDEDGAGDACDAQPQAYRGDVDSDHDGRPDREDSCPHIADDGLDFDGDGAANACDSDDDNDGLRDWIESGMTHWIPAAYTAAGDASPHGSYVPLNPQDADSDDDGLCDGPVSEVVGVCIGFDNCPDHYEKLAASGVLHSDAESDGIGNICAAFVAEGDADGDGIANGVDNCPLLPNREQINLDGDSWAFDVGVQRNLGGGNGCDPDADNDGAEDTFESGDPRLHSWEPDSDHYTGEGHDDYCDGPGTGFGSSSFTTCNPSDNCPVFYNPDQADSDTNGIGDVCDALGEGDRDNDGIPDSEDNCPTIPNADQADLDRDGRGDVCDDDNDGDGVPDRFDNCPGQFNPLQDNVCGADFSLGPVELVQTTQAVDIEGGWIPGGCALMRLHVPSLRGTQ